MSLAVGAPHGSGSNHANAGVVDLPIEPRRRETPDEFRARMDAKAARQRSFFGSDKKATASVVAAITDPDLEQAKFESEDFGDDTDTETAAAERAPERTAPKPAPPTQRTAAPSSVAQRNARWVDAYLIDHRTTADIGAEYGVSGSSVGRVLRSLGVEMRPPGPARGTPAVRRPAADRTSSIRPCAGTCGRLTRPASTPAATAPGTISRARKGMCMPCATAADRPAPAAADVPDVPGRFVDDEERARMVAAYVAGATAVEIGAQHGRRPKTVRQALRADRCAAA